MKPRIDLVPPSAISEVAQVMTNNEEKHGKETWKGVSWSDHYAAVQRHLLAFWDGTDIDPDGGLRHLAHACTRIMMLMCVSIAFDDRTHHKLYPSREPDILAEVSLDDVMNEVFNQGNVVLPKDNIKKVEPWPEPSNENSLNEVFEIDDRGSLIF